jgi:LPPG:FO 2-phospho-L-lactate transferase
MDGLRALGEEIWFNLGDRDLAIALQRQQSLRSGATLTEAHQRIAQALGVQARVLPAADRPVRTRVLADGRWWGLQEFMIRGRQLDRVDDVEFVGAANAGATPEVLDAIASAQALVIGPSNPVISIGPMLAIPELRAALRSAPAPVVAVSPIVGGQVLKGPTALFMACRGVPVDGNGIAALYDGLIDGLVCDDEIATLPSLRTDLLLDDGPNRRRLAAETLSFAAALGSVGAK